jgi:hypothetical protein
VEKNKEKKNKREKKNNKVMRICMTWRGNLANVTTQL